MDQWLEVANSFDDFLSQLEVTNEDATYDMKNWFHPYIAATNRTGKSRYLGWTPCNLTKTRTHNSSTYK